MLKYGVGKDRVKFSEATRLRVGPVGASVLAGGELGQKGVVARTNRGRGIWQSRGRDMTQESD